LQKCEGEASARWNNSQEGEKVLRRDAAANMSKRRKRRANCDYIGRER